MSAIGLVVLSVLVAVAAANVPAQEVKLFNGNDLAGWTYHSMEANAKMEDVWTVKDGMLICTGRDSGLLRTNKQYEDYVLTLDWRWTSTRAGDSGVFVHTTDKEGTFGYPESVEVSLFRENAGDILAFGPKVTPVHKEQTVEIHIYRKLQEDAAEKKMGEWNHLEVTCQGDEILVKVNGTLVNHVAKCTVTKGAICLAAQGRPIFFRNVKLTPLDKVNKAPARKTEPKKTEPKETGRPFIEGTFQFGSKTYKVQHGIAYRNKRNDEVETVVYLTENPFPPKALMSLKEALRKSGNDVDFFVFEPFFYIAVTIGDGSRPSVNVMLPRGAGFNISQDKSTGKVTGDRVQGRVFLPEPEEVLNEPCRCDVKFDLRLLSVGP